MVAAGDLRLSDRAGFHRLLNQAYGPERDAALGETHALLIQQHGQIVFEHYGDGFAADQTHASWSMAKSITQALAGMLIGDGKLSLGEPIGAPEWAAGDPRTTITLDHLLRMSSGLKFVEDYVGDGGERSDVLEMLYGSGKADMAAYAASRPLIHAPGSHWSYSSGTTNILARKLSQVTGLYGADFHAFMCARLFEPLGMESPVPKFDAAGTFIGSSYCFCTARDFARFGQLFLQDGVWQDARLLPEGWVDYTRRPTPQPPGADAGYGAQWWLGFGGAGSFSANGFESQITLVLPDIETVVVRLGKTPLAHKDRFKRWIGELAERLR